jgi:hypothetical protein
MSFDTNKTWFYQMVGRDIQLWQYVQTANTDTLAGYRIRLPNDYYGNQLIYPNEDITDGLRLEYTSIDEPFVAEALEDIQVFADGTDISFSTTVLTGAGTDDGFAIGDRVRIIGSASNDGDYTSTNEDDNTLTFPSSTFTAETAGESITVYQIPKEDSSPGETSHVNLNRMLSLACVDYIKAMISDMAGEVQKKEYYMREFWKKVGDNDSNKRKIAMLYPSGVYSVR